MSYKHYDFVFVGAGAAGLQLLLTMLDDSAFEKSSFLILDKSNKDVNDKTWCFWEDQPGPYEEIVYRRWEKGWFHSTMNSIAMDMGSYSYKMIRSIDFYKHALGRIADSPNVRFEKDSVEKIEEDIVTTSLGESYSASRIFDSRIPEEFVADKKSVKLAQHFLGWIVHFEEEVFEDDTFTMMDFRDKMPDTCSFMYVLPFSKTSGLLEFTFFNAKIIEKEEYEEYIKAYIEKHYPNVSYTIEDVETGVIPMTTFDFSAFHDKKITKIGTAGGWVKPSSGYSFKISQSFIKKVIENIKSGKSPHFGVARGKNRFYDSIFLSILKDENEKGESLFDNMYNKLPAHLIFKFLDEETNYSEDLRIMSKFANATFTKSFFKQLV